MSTTQIELVTYISAAVCVCDFFSPEEYNTETKGKGSGCREGRGEDGEEEEEELISERV